MMILTGGPALLGEFLIDFELLIKRLDNILVSNSRPLISSGTGCVCVKGSGVERLVCDGRGLINSIFEKSTILETCNMRKS